MKRLLVRLPNWLGDVLMARPLLATLRASLPDATRVWIGPASMLELLRDEDPAARHEPWPADGASRGALARRLRAERADTAVILPPSFSSALQAWHWGARARVGFAAEGRSWFLTHVVRRPPRGTRHLSEEYLTLGATLGVAPVPAAPLRVPEAWKVSARARLESAGFRGDRFCLVAPGALYGPAKRWPAERFAAVADALVAGGYPVVLAGGASDREASQQVQLKMRNAAIDLCGATALTEMAGLCAGASAVVSNDSGLAHLAAACAAPTVVIFGSTSSAWTAPLGPRVRVVQEAPVCAPCFQRNCAIGYRCLTAISAGRVERACREIAA